MHVLQAKCMVLSISRVSFCFDLEMEFYVDFELEFEVDFEV